MKTDSESCVDELLSKIANLEKNFTASAVAELEGEALRDAQTTLTSTQLFIENNRHLIPSYCQKKANESLSKLENLINRSCKSSIRFKFNSKKVKDLPASSDELRTEGPSKTKVLQPKIELDARAFGFHERRDETLELGDNDVKSKDVSLTKLENCVVTISGSANTVYIRELRGCKVDVRLAQRAITVINCEDCEFRLICQQLRIDSTTRSSFEIYTSARSMLESSKELMFKKLDFRDTDSRLLKLMSEANFRVQENQWTSIDDFDWLIPGKQSKNYSFFT